MKVMLLVNPSAGDGDHSAEMLQRAIAAAGYQVELGPADGEPLQQALRREDGIVAVAGGDGTVGRILQAMAGSGRPLAILPFGTANNIAASLGISGTAEELVARWADALRTFVEVGQVRGPWGETPFVESVGVGLLARLMSPAIGDRLEDVDEARSAAHRLTQAAPVRHWRVELDGVDCSGDYLLVEAMNIRCAGPNICFALRAEPNSGYLEIVFAGERERAALQGLVRDDRAPDRVLVPHAGRHLRLWCRPDELHIDDVHGCDLWSDDGLVQIDVALTGRGVEVLV